MKCFVELEKMDANWDRVFVACVTPYKPNSEEVDEQNLRELLEYFLRFRDKGLGGIVINPEAGDVFYLTREEKQRNVEIAKEEVGEKLPVIAGVFGITTKESMQVALDAKEYGVDGIFIFPPAGAQDVVHAWDPIKYPEVWIDQIKSIDSAVDMPIIVHPVGRFSPEYGIGMPAPFVAKACSEIPNIVGWKMTYNYEGYIRVARELRSLSRHVAILAAPANLFHAVLALDLFDGALTGSLNYSAELMLPHIKAFQEGNYKEAKRIWNAGLGELQEYIYSDMGRLHVRYKVATWLRGLIRAPLMRSPMPKPKPEEIETIKKLLDKAGLETIEENVVLSYLRMLY
jgi:4-hydroxy-tetrahydrodipicolinate synthase